MKTIVIAEGITATLTNKTYNAMCDYKKRSEELSRWQESAFEERDWGDYDYYGVLAMRLEEEYEWLWE